MHKTSKSVLPSNSTNINEVHTIINMEKIVTIILSESHFY